jgi:serine protease inhibitor
MYYIYLYPFIFAERSDDRNSIICLQDLDFKIATMAQETSFSESFVDLLNRFCFQLHSLTVVPDKPSGLCTMNIYQCLMMVAVGSKDRNLAEFGEALGFDVLELQKTVTNIVALDAYAKSSKTVELSSASSVWYEAGYVLETPWAETMETTFRATFGKLEVGPINRFIETETKGKLKNLVSANDLVGTVLMVITCLYFKAKWETPFNISVTQKAPFYSFENVEKTCSMMGMVGKLQYKDDKLAQICILPYKTDGISVDIGASISDTNSIPIEDFSDANSTGPSPQWKAAIILPKESGLPALQEILTAFSASTFNRVSLSLPRFTLKLHHDLIPSLETLGLGPAFKPSLDFAPISNSGKLLINRVTHDVFIEVNEEGTEMAATTVVGKKKRRRVETVEMRVDRPFLFLVFDGRTGLVLCSVVVSEVEDGSAR